MKRKDSVYAFMRCRDWLKVRTSAGRVTIQKRIEMLILSEELKDLLGPSLVAQLEEEAQVQDSATTTEDLPYHVAADLATDKTRRRLSNTLRDTEHMMLFISHRSEINALQVDLAQEAIIRKPKPQRRIAEVGLADRCSAANSLIAVVDKVSALKDALVK